MQKIIQRTTVAGLAVTLAGCSLLNAGGPAKAPSSGPAVVLTQAAQPSVLLAVVDGPGSAAALTRLVAATAQPLENLAVLQAGPTPQTIVSSTAPSPPTVTVAGKPQPPGGETSYLAAQYAGRLKRWKAALAAGQQAEAARTRQTLTAWLSGLRLPARVGDLTEQPGAADGLAGESAAAASALAGLAEENGNPAGGHRVVLLFTGNLGGRPPAGELAGDTVLVVTQGLPTAAAASAVQADLLAAGAGQAAVIGSEVTAAQLAALVSAVLGQSGLSESVSAPVLFANTSAALSPASVASLAALLPRLRTARTTAVINGFASAPGTAVANYTLSYRRAAAVAAYFEARGIPASSLAIVGHGATDLVAPGSSGSNRRVTVVVEAPAH